ncbi:hypothetical protein BVG16_13745 [Paenibacillus selenitireducens]|uniref:Phage neck terminator protein gp12-like domain-containing protein n=1 Tax=Paenibacillus selenitireducens TaxID=1324314 RepID=A0A1T2XC92_9BACL|nr:hypothetical protein [Paenibacillus selenitireducens]OPA77511.1 hypothetical protein BVG16_13745 [Paenibacillus selenitireducens]
MIQFKLIRSTIIRNLKAYLHLEIIEMNGGGDIPKTAFLTYDFTEGIGDAKGFPIVYAEENKIKYVETVPFTVSFLSYADDKATSFENAIKARDWFKTIGHDILKDLANVIVVDTGPVENRDIAIGIEWERRQGFEVMFRTLDIIETELNPIEKVNIKGAENLGS